VRPLEQAPAADKDIRRKGEEITAGEDVLDVGTFLTPPAIGLAAAVGADELVVIPPPRVAVLVLGDELLRSGRPRDGKVRDALAPQLPAWLAAMGARAASVDHIPDDVALTRDALLQADSDVVITTGSTASGVADHLREAFALVGGEWLVDGVAVRPGHPMKLGVDATGRLLVALPGNPLAALSGLLTLAWPAIEILAGRSLTQPTRASVTDPLACAPESSRLVPGTLTPNAHDIRASVTPAMRRGPAMLSGMSTADVMVLVEPPGVSPGDVVDVLPLPWTTGPVVPLP
jgi:molybdopterin molybdotransferase